MSLSLVHSGHSGEWGADHGYPMQEILGNLGWLPRPHLLPGDGPRHYPALLFKHPDRGQQLAAHRGYDTFSSMPCRLESEGNNLVQCYYN